MATVICTRKCTITGKSVPLAISCGEAYLRRPQRAQPLANKTINAQATRSPSLEASMAYFTPLLPSIEHKRGSRRREHALTLWVCILASIIRSLVDERPFYFQGRGRQTSFDVLRTTHATLGTSLGGQTAWQKSTTSITITAIRYHLDYKQHGQQPQRL